MASPDFLGWSNQLPADFSLGDESNSPRRRRRPLIERDRVLAELTEHADSALNGTGRLVMIRGEAGIGKSALIGAFCDEFGGAVARSHCDPVSPPAPLGAVIDLCDALDQDAGARLECAIGEVDASGVPYAVASALAATAPLVWVIEDAHWADGATLDVLRYVTRRLASMPVLLVVTFRGDVVGQRHPLTAALGEVVRSRTTVRIDLPPLSVFGVRALASARPDIDVADLHRVTGGNPFLVTEALAAGRRGAVPTSVRDMMVGRLTELSPHGRAAAIAVAVLGPDATVDLVGRVSPEPDAGVAECVSAGFLDLVGDRLAFRHELTRRAVCAVVPPDARRALHAAVVVALDSISFGKKKLSQLAFHAEKAGDTDALLRYADAAAERAATRGEHREAVDQYTRALRHADGVAPEMRAAWWEKRSRAAYLCGLSEDCVRSIGQAVTLRRETGDDQREGDDLRLLAQRSYPATSLDAVRELAERAVGLLEPLGPSVELAWAYATRAQFACLAYDHSAVDADAQEAIRLARLCGASAAEKWAGAFEAISMVTRGAADWAAFEALRQDAKDDPASIEAVDTAAALAAWVAVQRHDRTAAERNLLACEDLLGDHDLAGRALMRKGTRAMLALDAGHCAEAEVLAVSVLNRPGGTPLDLLQAQVVAAAARARAGRGDVWPLLDQALGAHDPDDLMRTGIVWAARIEAAWLAGDKDGARVEAEQALSTLTEQVDEWLVGRIGAWAQIVGIEEPSLPRHPSGPYGRQLKGDWLGAAVEWERLGCPYQASIARLHVGAADVAEAGLAALEALGAHAAAAVGRAMLRSRGCAKGTGSDDLKLSSRQWQVAELLVEQYTDREIASALAITTKTASHHVSAILSKLGVRTRAAARRRVLEARLRVS